MSQENVEIVRRFLGQVNQADLHTALRSVAADAVLDWSRSDAPDGGVHSGREAWRDWISSRWEGLDQVRFEPTEILDVPPDRVLLVARFIGTGRASGLDVDALAAAVITLRGGRLTKLTLYQARGEALKAVGLEE